MERFVFDEKGFVNLEITTIKKSQKIIQLTGLPKKAKFSHIQSLSIAEKAVRHLRKFKQKSII